MGSIKTINISGTTYSIDSPKVIYRFIVYFFGQDSQQNGVTIKRCVGENTDWTETNTISTSHRQQLLDDLYHAYGIQSPPYVLSAYCWFQTNASQLIGDTYSYSMISGAGYTSNSDSSGTLDLSCETFNFMVNDYTWVEVLIDVDTEDTTNLAYRIHQSRKIENTTLNIGDFVVATYNCYEMN